MVVILLIINRFQNFCTVRFSSKFAATDVFIENFTAPYMRRYTTLWIMNVRKWATVPNYNAVTNNKLQGTVVTYLRCDGIGNNKIKKGLLLSLPVKKN